MEVAVAVRLRAHKGGSGTRNGSTTPVDPHLQAMPSDGCIRVVGPHGCTELRFGTVFGPDASQVCLSIAAAAAFVV